MRDNGADDNNGRELRLRWRLRLDQTTTIADHLLFVPMALSTVVYTEIHHYRARVLRLATIHPHSIIPNTDGRAYS